MSNILFNFPTVILWMLLCLSARTTLVLCDEQPVELSPDADIKKVSSSTESNVEESVPDSKSKDGDTLDAEPSIQNSQTDYNYVMSKPQSISLDLGSHSSSVQSSAQDQQIGGQYDSQSQSAQQPQSVIYRYTSGSDGGSALEPSGQQTYIRQEPQVYEPKSYVRQALLSNLPESSAAQTPGTGYRVPELPNTKPGISTTYYSPNVKIVSHTRSFLPVVYNKPTDESPEGSGQTSSDEQEYDKAVQERPGGSYSQQQQGDSYESNSNSQNDDQDEQSGPSQHSYDKPNDYRNEEQDRNSDVLSRGPYYNIHKPHVAHIQVIEDKDEYNNAKKEEYGSGPSYGYRTQPRPQYKNYKPSGYQPGMLNAFDPPSPPMSSLMPALPVQSLRGSDSEPDDEDSYDNREQSGRGQHLPDPQPLQQLSQSPHEYKQRPGVEIEFDQNQKNEPNVVRGPGLFRRPNNYNEGSDQSDDEQGYNQEQDRPNNSHDSGHRGQEFINNNQLGPKYNAESDESEQPYKRGRPQQQPLKPQEIEYGFIPLSEAKDISESFRGQEQAFRDRPSRPNRPVENGYGPEGYRDQRPHGGNGGGSGGGGNGGPHLRRPQYGPPEALMYGPGVRGQAEGHRGGGYNGNDIYRDTPAGPAQPSLGAYRKPSFERPGFMKNGGEENSGGFGMLPPFASPPKDDEEEEVDGDDRDYGKQNDIKNSTDNNKEEMVGPSDPDKLPHECYPWNCNPWHAIHPDSPYNSGAPLKGRGPFSGSGLPPGASYNPRDVGLDEAVVAQLNLAASSPSGIGPPGLVPPIAPPHGLRGGSMGAPPGLDMSFAANRPLPNFNGASSQRPKPRPGMPFSANGQGYRSQYGYRAAASELSPVSAAQSSQTSANSPVLSNLLNLNPVKSFRSLMSYLTGGLNE